MVITLRYPLPMILMTGKETAEAVYDGIRQKLEQDKTLHPTLAVILVGDDPASLTYVESKEKKCAELGFGHVDYHLPSTMTMEGLLAIVKELNADRSVHGILVQSPLPKGLDEEAVIEAIDPRKDVDGFHPVNVGKLLIGMSCFVSCTPAGVMFLLDRYHIATKGKHVVIIGRSNIVGKPLAALLMQKGRDATVTVCNSFTENLSAITRSADILVSAIGKPEFIKADMVKEGAVVIDIGINRVPDSTKKRGYRVTGDVDFADVSGKTSAITPVPGGVGVMTIAMLMQNTLKAALQ
jgi:methylenetetrahydrofolate dehydrogenase (NADP+)/methenyltetrahydrofolate cyclohydrolase